MIFPALGAMIGFALGIAWFASLRINTELFVTGGPIWRPIALQILRLTVVGVGFAVFALQGVSVLLAALAGFLAARAIAFRRSGMRAG